MLKGLADPAIRWVVTSLPTFGEPEFAVTVSRDGTKVLIGELLR
jgi:hypothetical protein